MSSNEVNMSTGKEVEDAETTVEIKIKTLDSQTYTLRVNKCVPIPALKEQIATVTGVLSDQQRLICRGKVLRDDELLSAYHVEDGHTLHLVVRHPTQASASPSTSFMGPESAAGQPAANFASSNDHNRGNPFTHSIVFEAVNVGQGDNSSIGLGQVISSILSSIWSANTTAGNTRTDNREANSERHGRTLGNLNRQDSNPLPQRAAPGLGFDSQQTASQVPAAVNPGYQQPLVIPDSLTTINEYIGFLRDEFAREGFRPVGNDNTEAPGTHSSEGQNNDLQSQPAYRQGTLPTPAFLAEIVQATGDLLIEQARLCLSQFARLLEDQTNVTDPLARMSLQTTAMRTGTLLQNLGPLLLELGRTTMTLRMGQAPSEAVVSAGPAVFISSSAPNTLMVQAFPPYAGPSAGRIHMGATNFGSVHESGQPIGSSHLPRNVDIRIHAGEQVRAQNAQEQMDAVRNSARVNSIRQVLAAASGNESPGESRVRLVPVRTVVALPAGVSHSPSAASGGGVGVIYPVLASVQQMNSSINDARGSQVSAGLHAAGSETSRQATFQSTTQRQNLDPNSAGAMSVDSHFSPNATPASEANPANISSQRQGSARVYISSQRGVGGNANISTEVPVSQNFQGDVFSRLDQVIRTGLREEINTDGIGHRSSGTNSAADQVGATGDAEMRSSVGNSQVNDRAAFISNLLQQIMPHLPQVTSNLSGSFPTNSSSSAQNERGNDTDSRHPQSRRDPPADSNPKRQKRD
ncbi:Ubiquitin-like protein [Dioscorea alata]|uniref:Ubiquitin-like protein n=2 Tax=Dioscorea alata TaxID=55571 RepID=A0ACB7VLG8_DIOAL|nr:Ubiquitin-like protein [Dioscorea alata]KAH7675047.1 Ubiquitin-like protein [Dioscorea alata]